MDLKLEINEPSPRPDVSYNKLLEMSPEQIKKDFLKSVDPKAKVLLVDMEENFRNNVNNIIQYFREDANAEDFFSEKINFSSFEDFLDFLISLMFFYDGKTKENKTYFEKANIKNRKLFIQRFLFLGYEEILNILNDDNMIPSNHKNNNQHINMLHGFIKRKILSLSRAKLELSNTPAAADFSHLQNIMEKLRSSKGTPATSGSGMFKKPKSGKRRSGKKKSTKAKGKGKGPSQKGGRYNRSNKRYRKQRKSRRLRSLKRK